LPKGRILVDDTQEDLYAAISRLADQAWQGGWASAGARARPGGSSGAVEDWWRFETVSALLPVNCWDGIPPACRATPVAGRLAYHNLKTPQRSYDGAELLIGTCLDNRIALRIHDNFAYILRAGGANLQRIECKVSYAAAVGGVRTICLIRHGRCGLVDSRARRDVFMNGLVENGGWERREAEQHFDQFALVFEIRDPAEFLLGDARRLGERCTRAAVAPLFYQIREGLPCQITEREGC
jgi:carbonic anhydrase